MKWDALEIARFARNAGFVGEDVRLATAVAVATSGGVATYDHRAGAPGTGHWRGLWGIDVDRYPDFAARDLLVPNVAAAAARELVDRTDGWEWSPVYRAGTYRHHLEDAGVARTRETEYQTPQMAFTIPETDRRIRHALDRLHALRSNLAITRRTGR